MTALNSEKRWYDVPIQDNLHLKKKKGAKHEFGIDYEPVWPSEEEIRLLGNRNKNCRYYHAGVELCHHEVMADGKQSFLPCKPVIDGMWRCYTEGKYG